MKDAIFGFSGFVGSYLTRYYKFDYLYNSKNITDAKNKEFDTIFISCIPAIKWLANKYPDKDKESIANIKKILETIQAKKVILISTIDVYDMLNTKSNEDEIINYNNNNSYGKNRYLFEEFVRTKFSNVYIIRLPALFGRGLKKNILYDLLNNNDVNNININTSFQWYNLEWLHDDIENCLQNNIILCNLFTEPLHTKDIVSLFPEYTLNNDKHICFYYDVTTKYYKYFHNGLNGYIRNKKIVFDDIAKYVEKIKKEKECKIKLCVSNISNYNLCNEQYYNILNHYNINYIEIAPTKFNNWEQLINSNILKNEKEKMSNFNLELYSFQSITYQITDNIFQVEDNTTLLNHLKKVIDLAIDNNVKNLVFGCPRNRLRNILTDDNYDKADDIFITFFRNLGNYIDKSDLIISIENNSKMYNCNYLNTINDVGNIVQKINHDNIKMMVDIGNCIMEDDIIDNLIHYKNLINHVHISMPFMKQFINYNKNEYIQFINLLKKINYDKIISLEFLNNDCKNDNDELYLLNKSLSSFIELFI